MNSERRTSVRTLLPGIVLAVLTMSILLVWKRSKEVRRPLPVYGQVTQFALTNQFGDPVSLESLRGQVWVADVIFTRCPLACPQMTGRMSELQSVLPAQGPIKLISVSTDPEFDTPPILKNYADRAGARSNLWWFLTGTKEQVGHALTNCLSLTAVENKPEQRTNQYDLFTHSTVFLLIDKRAQIRGAVESLEAGWRERIQADIHRLLRED